MKGGAHFTVVRSGQRIAGHSKDDFLEAVQENPSNVHLYTMTSQTGFHGRASALPEDVTFTVMGPDAYHNPRWEAVVCREGDKVSAK